MVGPGHRDKPTGGSETRTRCAPSTEIHTPPCPGEPACRESGQAKNMQIQVVTPKSAKATPEFLILEIPSGNRNKNAYPPTLAPLPQFFSGLPPPPGKGAKPFMRR